ncbi:hypothetical protein [Microbacterium sp. AK009]|uniref:hypothetical protein n=1 Tax=Microbacterium sp. AK009 TaxID=2723068 RepID=UPI0027BA0EF0|nr:hypothetical protein [Microbacterium sp. AK009]
MPRPSASGSGPRLLFQEVGAVGEQDRTEFGRASTREDGTAEAVTDERRQVAGVIQVAWVGMTASMELGSTGKGARLRARSTLKPWKSPQSTKTRRSERSTR